MVAIVYLAVLGLVWLTLAMRKQEQSKWLKHAAVSLHVLFDLVFIMLVGRGGLGEAAERGCGVRVGTQSYGRAHCLLCLVYWAGIYNPPPPAPDRPPSPRRPPRSMSPSSTTSCSRPTATSAPQSR